MTFRTVIDAFFITPETQTAFQAASEDRSLRNSRMTLHAGGLSGAIEHYAHTPNPQVVVVEEDDDDQTMLNRLEHLAEMCEAGAKVVVVGRLNDVDLYRRLLAGGVSEYLIAPIAPAQLATAIAALFADPAQAPRGKIITVWSARGGNGGSTIARNLAWHAGKVMGEQAVYLDLDIWFGNSDLAFNLEIRQGAADALAQPERLDSVLLDRFLVVHDDHLRILASAGGAPRNMDVTTDAAEALADMAARTAPVVVLDLPHLWAPWTEALLASADETIIVARPDLACLRDAKILFDYLAPRRLGAAPPRLVLNGVDQCRKTQLTAKDFQETLGIAPSLNLAWDSVLFGEAANNGQLPAQMSKGNKASAQIEAFAASLLGRAPSRNKTGWNFLDWLKG